MLHPTFIRHLLGVYRLPGLDPALVEQVEEAAANLVGPDLSQRLADAVWRLRLRDGQTAYLLAECQSQPNPAKPYRMLHAVATLALALRSVTLEEMLETEPRTWADRIRDEGRQEGREQGLERERKLLLRLVRVRFGGPLERNNAALLEPVTDADRLEQIGEWLLVYDSGEALLARLRQA